MNPGSGVSHRDADYAWCKKKQEFYLGIGNWKVLHFSFYIPETITGTHDDGY